MDARVRADAWGCRVKICLTCEGVAETDEDRCVHCDHPLIHADQASYPLRRGDDGRHGPLVGRVVDAKYRVLGVLGRGGMGTVYRAVHEVSHAPVALKVLNPRFAARSAFRSWFLGEARKAGSVAHEYSARVQDVGETRDGTVYLAVEYVDGETLRASLERTPGPSPAWVVDVLEQTARGLAAAHDAGVVHRDLSPRNVMVVGGGASGGPRVKILDFGIATGAPGGDAVRVADPSRGGLGNDAFAAPAMFANPPYSAPEHVRGDTVDGRADLYSLGVIAYEALTGGDLPVPGDDPDALLAATRDGQIDGRLPRLPGVPRALSRLVRRLLEPLPDDRPANAHAVADELARIASRRGRAVSIWALISIVLGGGAFLATMPGRTQPSVAFLRSLPGPGGWAVTAGPSASDEAARELRSEEFLAARFLYDGFVPAQLSLRLSRGGEAIETLALRGALTPEDGELRFDADGAAPVLEALRKLAPDGPVDLAFLRDGVEPVGYAQLRLDDVPPELALEVEPAATSAEAWPSGRWDVLRGDHVLRVQATDDGRLAELRLDVRIAAPGDESTSSGAVEQLLSVPLSTNAASGESLGRADELLAAAVASPRRHPSVEIRVFARDTAGNESSSMPLRFGAMDLTAPGLIDVRSARGSRVVVEDATGAALSLRLDGLETGLRLEGYPPGGDGWTDLVAVPEQTSDALDVVLPRGLLDDPATGLRPSGRWGFRLRDAAGNRGGSWFTPLEFRPEEPNARFDLSGDDLTDPAEPGAIAAVWVDDLIVAGGAPFAIDLRCNPLYRPGDYRVARIGGDVVQRGAVDASQPGQGVLRLARLGDGDYRITVQLVDEAAATAREVSGPALTVLPEPLRLELPRVEDDLVYLADLQRALLLERDGSRLRQGSAWQLSPAEPRLLRGTILRAGRDGVWRRVADVGTGLEDTETSDLLLRDVPLQDGFTQLAVALRDALGRAVRVMCGGEPAMLVDAGPDFPGAALVASFWHHDRPVAALDPVVLFEHQQPLRLLLQSAVPLPADPARISLAIGGRPLRPQLIQAVGPDASRLLFTLPFDRVAVATDLLDVGRQQFAAGRRARLVAELSTPVGEQSLELELRTIRSTLRPVRLGSLRDDLPPALQDLELVPVLGPGLGEAFADPVPATLPARAAFRPAPAIAVRSVDDFYLQRTEMTRAQYAAVVEHGLLLVRAGGLSDGVTAADLVHAADPLGPARLTQAALAPRRADGSRVAIDSLRAEASSRPITGVDAFQASCVIRMLGVLVGGTPELFRLPLGVELEIAAFGADHRPAGPAPLRGSSVRGITAPSGGGWRRAHRKLPNGAAPLPAESRALGDVVATSLGEELIGLDGGVREWVGDLPFIADDVEGRALLVEWLADHLRHVERTSDLAEGRLEGFPRELLGRLRLQAAVRGAPVLGGAVFARPPSDDSPGVVNTLQLRGDGSGLLPGSLDPRLIETGLRVAGARRFLQEVRRR